MVSASKSPIMSSVLIQAGAMLNVVMTKFCLWQNKLACLSLLRNFICFLILASKVFLTRQIFNLVENACCDKPDKRASLF